MKIIAPPKLGEYLDDLITEQGFGTSRGEVARTLLWERIRELISLGVLDRRRPSLKDYRLVAKRMAPAVSTRKKRTPKR